MAIRKKKKSLFKRRRVLDPATIINYKDPESLKRFITERGKIIPRRISGASSSQQRKIATEVRRARYLSLLPFSIAHRSEKNMAVELALAAASASFRRGPSQREEQGDSRRDSGERRPDNRDQSDNSQRNYDDDSQDS